jgi:membrane-bound serine protease (ClpP class)
MVDEDIQVDSISQEGKVITFSTIEAIENGFCEAELNSIEEILKRNNIENYKVERYELSSTENIISLFLNPVVSSILILLIIGGLYFELQTPGIGFPIMASIVALILYLTPYYLNGLAENWEIFLFLIGMIFIVIEVFVIPGFGVAGIFGLALTIGSLMLLMLNNDVFDFTFVVSKDILNASGSILIAVLGFGLLLFFGGIKFTESQVFKRVMLEDTQDLDKGYISRKYSDKLIGKSGKAMTILRPSGKITISDKIYDATTSGEYIEKKSKIIVLSNEGSTLKVKKS